MRNSPTCCGCINLKTGAMILTIIYLVFGSVLILGGIILLSILNHKSFLSYESKFLTELIFDIIVGLIIVVCGSLAVHGIRTKHARLIVPIYIYGILDVFGSVIVATTLCISWNAIYKILLKSTSQNIHHMFHTLGSYGSAILVIGLAILLICLKIYLTSVFYRCFKHIQMECICTFIYNFLIAQNLMSIIPKCSMIIQKFGKAAEDAQRVPLLDNRRPSPDMPPPYTARNE